MPPLYRSIWLMVRLKSMFASDTYKYAFPPYHNSGKTNINSNVYIWYNSSHYMVKERISFLEPGVKTNKLKMYPQMLGGIVSLVSCVGANHLIKKQESKLDDVIQQAKEVVDKRPVNKRQTLEILTRLVEEYVAFFRYVEVMAAEYKFELRKKNFNWERMQKEILPAPCCNKRMTIAEWFVLEHERKIAEIFDADKASIRKVPCPNCGADLLKYVSQEGIRKLVDEGYPHDE